MDHLGNLHVEHASCGCKLDEGVIGNLVDAAPLLALPLPIFPAGSPSISNKAISLAAEPAAECRMTLVVSLSTADALRVTGQKLPGAVTL